MELGARQDDHGVIPMDRWQAQLRYVVGALEPWTGRQGMAIPRGSTNSMEVLGLIRELETGVDELGRSITAEVQADTISPDWAQRIRMQNRLDVLVQLAERLDATLRKIRQESPLSYTN